MRLAMNREDLEILDRDTLIQRAQALGVARAGVLTRPELVDEILVRGAGPSANGHHDARVRAARGLFGRARDLLARVIERGRHLPDAAELFRGRPNPGGGAGAGPAAAVPTVTLAEIYAAQGHKAKAVETLRRVLETESDHAAAKALLSQIEEADLPPPVLPPEDEELADGSSDEGPRDEKLPAAVAAEAPELGGDRPFLLDDEPLPPRYDVDECVAIPVDPTTMFVYWEVRDATRAHLERTRPGGGVTLRALLVIPTWDGPRVEIRDFSVEGATGDFFVRDLPRGAVVRTAIGWRVGAAFVPSAHSPALETLAGEPSPLMADRLVRWTPQGTIALAGSDHETPGLLRALGIVGARLRAEARRAAMGGAAGGPDALAFGAGALGGSSAPHVFGAGVSSSSGVSSFAR
jgi:hypothetical protein